MTGTNHSTPALLSRKRKRPVPTRAPGSKTYDNLILATKTLLGEVGFERLTTNEICARASLTPPAFYHYFSDKYDILEEVACNLLNRQNDAMFAWLFTGGLWQLSTDPEGAIRAWYRIAAGIIAEEPGALWTMRAIRALPSLAHLRTQSQRLLADHLRDALLPLRGNIDPVLLWQRLRISCELGYMVDELSLEEDRVSREMLFAEVARLAARL